ncbi:DUF4381 domain-containing protein [Pseudoalteromonas tunicata]|jgi:hypothetical protein|uniref:Putative orphan protein n=1 Tax=Pseudoalteromonas tunicata D2 TaxID=87626 RepID=A4C686_9GAMM|nr:DUF4381 domain-containing protein [Pseudoalteromonas tunicata]ATC95464.1 hypothetical protein PTUN_a3076 [Pseudoalteromonas tunicata]AXT31039.1 DUF4381 domain-containing protein [Pseudoalteromonas tunicata]EAR29490.1 putative orphan protein [Pseudoalteromonas tunicata D2]
MNASPLDNLNDIIAPTTVPFWPLSPAWWLVIAVSLILILSVFLYWRIIFRHNSAKREAIALSNTLTNNQMSDLQQLNIILKRLTQHYYGTSVASLSGKAWCDFLQQHCQSELNPQQLQSIYQAHLDNTTLIQLKTAYLAAIKHFKTRGHYHV